MTIETFRPFGDRLLVKPDAMPNVSESGLIHYPEIVTADNPNHFTMTGVVVKLGDGVRLDIYRCNNQQCRAESRRQAGDKCPRCGASLSLHVAEERVPFDVKVGDRVSFNRFAGKEVEIERGRYLLMRESELMGIADAGARVGPVYEEPKFGKVTKGLTPDAPLHPRY